jgi:hypothetical protein
LLEAKAMLVTLSPTWAKTISSLHEIKTNLTVEAAPDIVLPAPIPPVTPAEMSPEILLGNFQLSLKVLNRKCFPTK